MRRPIQAPNSNPAFLGIGTGKRKRAKAEAARIAAEEERKTLQLKADLAAQGYKTTEEKKVEAEVTAKTIEAAAKSTDSQSDQTLYYIIGAVVVAVMVGLYFITKKH